MSNNGASDDDKTPRVFPRQAKVPDNTVIAHAIANNCLSRYQRLKRQDAIAEKVFTMETPVDMDMLRLYAQEIRGDIADDQHMVNMLDPGRRP